MHAARSEADVTRFSAQGPASRVETARGRIKSRRLVSVAAVRIKEFTSSLRVHMEARVCETDRWVPNSDFVTPFDLSCRVIGLRLPLGEAV